MSSKGGVLSRRRKSKSRITKSFAPSVRKSQSVRGLTSHPMLHMRPCSGFSKSKWRGRSRIFCSPSQIKFLDPGSSVFSAEKTRLRLSSPHVADAGQSLISTQKTKAPFKALMFLLVEMAEANPRPERCQRVIYVRRSFHLIRCVRFETVKIRTLPILKFRSHSKETYTNYPDNMTCPSAHRESSGDTSLLKRRRMQNCLLRNTEKQS